MRTFAAAAPCLRRKPKRLKIDSPHRPTKIPYPDAAFLAKKPISPQDAKEKPRKQHYSDPW